MHTSYQNKVDNCEQWHPISCTDFLKSLSMFVHVHVYHLLDRECRVSSEKYGQGRKLTELPQDIIMFSPMVNTLFFQACSIVYFQQSELPNNERKMRKDHKNSHLRQYNSWRKLMAYSYIWITSLSHWKKEHSHTFFFL